MSDHTVDFTINIETGDGRKLVYVDTVPENTAGIYFKAAAAGAAGSLAKVQQGLVGLIPENTTDPFEAMAKAALGD